MSTAHPCNSAHHKLNLVEDGGSLENGLGNSIFAKKCKQFPVAYAFVELIQFAFYRLGIHPSRKE